jgi:hypothetical protein
MGCTPLSAHTTALSLSKVGTFLTNAAGQRERVEKAWTAVPDACEIEFGQGSRFKVTRVRHSACVGATHERPLLCVCVRVCVRVRVRVCACVCVCVRVCVFSLPRAFFFENSCSLPSASSSTHTRPMRAFFLYVFARQFKTPTPIDLVCRLPPVLISISLVEQVAVVLSNCGTHTTAVTATATKHGVAVKSVPTASVYAIVMAERTVTQKAMLGLCYGCAFVTPTWFENAVAMSTDGPVLRREVDPALHVPPLVDKTLHSDGGAAVPWDPNVARAVYVTLRACGCVDMWKARSSV